MAAPTIRLGQRFRKADCSRLTFEVVDCLDIDGLAHVRLAVVESPLELRVYAAQAVADRRLFVPLDDAPPARAG